jgi:hypothetical protein
VDDLPWLDLASAAVLEYAQRRLTTQPAGLLATVATGDSDSAAALLRRWFPPGRLEVLTAGPLPVAALGAVLRAKRGAPGTWPEVVEVHEASGGNPYFAMELAAALGARGHRRDTRQPLPVPGSLRPLVRRRLQALSPAGQMFPAMAAPAPTFHPSPGDQVTASVTGDAGLYTLSIQDLTSGMSFTVNKNCASCHNSSAEVTAGSPPGVAPADFTIVHFTNIVVTNSTGVSGGLANSAWLTDQLTQPGSPHTVPGPLHTFSSPAHSAFADTWAP